MRLCPAATPWQRPEFWESTSNSDSFFVRQRNWAGFKPRHFSQDTGRFFLKRTFQRLVITVGKFSRLVLEVQIAQVLIHHFLAFLQIREPRFLRPHMQSSRKVKDVEEDAERHHSAGQSCDSHTSVSFLAWMRKRSSSPPLTG